MEHVYFKESESLSDRLGQNVIGKFRKLSKISFSMENYRFDFMQFFSATAKVFSFEWLPENSPLIPNISDTLSKFPNFSQILQSFS